MTYEEVFAEVLALRGEGALASAGVLVGCAMDVSGAEWQRENRVLSRVLDDEALGPFAGAGTPSELAAARASLRARLVGEECLSEAVAEAICGGLAGGIASWRGFGEAPGGEEPDGTAPRAYPDGDAPDGERGGARLDLALADVDPIPPQAYTGGPITPEPGVRLGGRTLENGRDYRLIYYTNVGSATSTSEAQVVVRGIWSGGYTGAKAVRFKIAPKQMDAPEQTDAGAQRVLPDGSVYEGGWEDGAPSGSGKMWYPDGSTYDGEWRDGRRSGRGRMTWRNGRTYDGEWRDGVRSGRGRCTWSDGSVYEGEWRDDAPSGRGAMAWSDGFTYEGEWRDGKLDLALADVDPILPQTYTGEPITPEPVVRQGGRTLENGRDYTLAYYANVGSPTATSEARVVVRHTVSGKYAGEKAVSFKIVPQQMDTAKRSDDDNADRKTCGCGCLWFALSALFWIIIIGEASRGNQGVGEGIFVVWIAVTIVFTLFNQPHSEK